jgi:nucleotide-binding universal stress UspA family protein
MFAKLLVPLDGSQLAERALEPALQMAQFANSQIVLLRVPVFRQVMLPDAAGEVVVWDENLDDRTQAEAEDYLEQIRSRYPHINIITRVISGDEAGVIIDTAGREAADLVIMSTHGYSGFTRWVMGSVTERVLRHAPCPVLVVRKEGPISNVVITLDGSPLAESALEPGLAIARYFGARACLLRVYYGGSLTEKERVQINWTEGESGASLYEQVQAGVKQYLDELAQAHQSAGQIIETAVMEGSPAFTILDYAEARSTDLLVMATHGRTGLRRFVYGSVTEKMMRSIDCNILIIRPEADAFDS